MHFLTLLVVRVELASEKRVNIQTVYLCIIYFIFIHLWYLFYEINYWLSITHWLAFMYQRLQICIQDVYFDIFTKKKTRTKYFMYMREMIMVKLDLKLNSYDLTSSDLNVCVYIMYTQARSKISIMVEK